MFNLLLRFDRFGRMVLSRDERRATQWFALCLALGAGGLVAWARHWEGGLLVAIVGGVLSMCVAATFQRLGRPRLILGWATVALAAAGVGGIALLLQDNVLGDPCFDVFVFGFIAFQIAANVLRR